MSGDAEVTTVPGRCGSHRREEVNHQMDSKQKLRAAIVGGLVALLAVVAIAGGVSAASGVAQTTPVQSTAPAASAPADRPSQGVPTADSPANDAATGRDGRHPCPEEGGGAGSGAGSSEQATPAAPTTTNPEL
jgi:hypothetical protein